MKLGVSRISDEQRQRVITLRRNNSLSKVSELVGLPLGTVKTILSRSGLFKDNPAHRAMFQRQYQHTTGHIRTTTTAGSDRRQ